MSHAHVVVIHNDGQHINRRAIRAQQDHVIQLFIGDFHITLNFVTDHRRAVLRSFDPHHIWRIRMAGCIRITPRAAIKRGFAFLFGFVTEGLNLVLCRKTFIGLALGQKL